MAAAAHAHAPSLADPRLIVPLDLPSAGEARTMVDAIGDAVSFYKVGLELFAGGEGMVLARELKAAGKQVFLDWKLHDIGTTVQRAAAVIAQSGCDVLTVHGEPQVMASAVRGRGASGLKILAVTVLTSLDRADLDANLIRPGDLAEITLERAARALAAGADGVIASPQEAAAIRALPGATGRLIVTPGVRPAGATSGDQKRIATPAQAIADGADHIVIGRPIWQARDPATVARAILASLPLR